MNSTTADLEITVQQQRRRSSSSMERSKKNRQVNSSNNSWNVTILAKSLGNHIQDFIRTSNLHGVRYFNPHGIHFIESLLWFTIFLFSIYGAYILTSQSWRRYNANPTVTAIQKNYREWNITFPSATFCMLDALDKNKATDYIARIWGIVGKPKIDDEVDDEVFGAAAEDVDNTVENATDNALSPTEEYSENKEFDYYMEFLRALVNTTYENVDKFVKYQNDDTLKNIDIEYTIMEVLLKLDQKSTFFDKEFAEKDFRLVPTEMGVCYTHGNVLADQIPWRYGAPTRYNFKPPICNFNNYVCYARTEGLPNPVRYYIHSPYEIPDIGSRWFHVPGRTDSDTSFTYLETVAAPELYRLTPSQRKCRFFFEPTVSHLPVYSFNLCRMQCRKQLAFKLCGCAPYFYTKESKIPVCNVKGLACLAPYSDMLITLRNSDGRKLPCHCLPQCIDVTYVKFQETLQQWTFPVPYDIRFRWVIEKFTRMRVKRDVIYSFEDLLVSVGGTAALFLGCSVLSFVEIIYFFTLRLYFVITKLFS